MPLPEGNRMKQVLSYFAAILNVTIAVAIVAFGIFAVSETKAKIRLADISHEDFILSLIHI